MTRYRSWVHARLATRLGLLLVVPLLLGLLAPVAAPPRSARAMVRTFTSLSPLTIGPGIGAASLYPSTIPVAGLTGRVTHVTVGLVSLTHTYPRDVDVLLVGPGGQGVILMSDVGASSGVQDLSLTFDDRASTTIAAGAQLTSGTYQPTNLDGGALDTNPPDNFAGFSATPSAPSQPTGDTLAVFNGADPNVDWRVYVLDDSNHDEGSLAGWSLTIETNAAPIAQNDTVVVLANTPVDIDVLANDGDPDPGDAINRRTVAVVSGPAHGTASANQSTGLIRYAPTSQYHGTDSLTYTVKDNLGSISNVATVRIDVTPQQLPVAQNDTVTTTQNTPVKLDILANDFDSDGTIVPASVHFVAGAAHGTFGLTGVPGEILYTPMTDFVGTDDTAYVVADNDGLLSNLATITFNVVAAAPTSTKTSTPTSTPAPTVTATSTSTPTPTVTSTPTASVVVPPAAPSTPQPVRLSMTRARANLLQVSVTTVSPLQRVAWTPDPAFTIEAANGARIEGGSLTLPPNTTTATFYVRRLGTGAVTVPLTLTGAFGTWQTLVGGGANAW